METKPQKPIEPRPCDFPREKSPATEKTPFIIAYRKYQKEMEQYKMDLELYEQTKLIKFVKNADIKLILKKYLIIKK